MKHLAVLTLVAISFSAIQAQIVSEYFPVSLGNVWEYEREDTPIVGFRYTVVDGDPLFPNINTFNMVYDIFNIETGSISGSFTSDYVEIGCPNIICEAFNGGTCFPILPVMPINGDSINATAPPFYTNLKVEFIGDYTVPAGTFSDCYLIKAYGSAATPYPKEELIIAKNVGIIRRSTNSGVVFPPGGFISLINYDVATEPPQNEPSLSLEHFHFIPNNPKFDSPLGIGHSDEVEYFSVCADGSFASSFTVTVDADMEGNPLIPIEDIGVRINNSTFETTEFLGQSFINANNPGDPSFEIVYKHPEMIPEAAENYHTLQLEIYSLSNDCKIYKTFPIRVYRAPVLLVHGLFGNGTSMVNLRNYIADEKINPLGLISNANYEGGNDEPFIENKKIIPLHITKRLDLLRRLGISSGKMNVVVHSMGGVLTRLYLQSDQYRGDIFKFILINTPNYGSQLANLLLDENFSIDLRTEICENLSRYDLGNCYGGAVSDLRVNSPAIIDDLNGLLINNATVPTHAIFCRVDENSSYPQTLRTILDFSGEYNQLFNGENNDIVVAVSSQKGGIDMFEALAVTNFENISHLGSYNKNLVQEKVKTLLLASANIDSFSTQGFAQNTLEYQTPNISATASMRSLNVSFTSPQDNEIVQYGETITISASSDNSPEKITLTVGELSFDEESVRVFDGNEYSVSYEVTPGELGSLRFKSFARQQGLGYGSDKIIINVTTDEVPNTILPFEDIVVEVGKKTDAFFIGNFSSIGEVYISREPSVEFIFEHGYAEHIGDGVIRGLTSGTDTLRVIFNGVESEPMRVLVLDEDEITETTIIRPETTQLGSLDIFPNPSSGPMTMRFVAEDNGERIIRIFDVTGREVNRLRVTANQGENLVDFSTNNLAKGIYFVRVNGEKQRLVEKFIRM